MFIQLGSDISKRLLLLIIIQYCNQFYCPRKRRQYCFQHRRCFFIC